MAVFLIFVLIGIIFVILFKNNQFNRSKYKKNTGNKLIQVMFDKGSFGEYLTSVELEKLNIHHYLLTNLYIPKKDGSTTEIDLVMLAETGIYVIESKNFSGWIFGDEKNKYWMQTFKNGQKFRFFNPIWQNQGHVNALKTVLDIKDDIYLKSYIVFSNRCTLREINVTSSDVKVMKRNRLNNIIKEDMNRSVRRYSIAEIDQFYTRLIPYMQVDDTVKVAHIKSIHTKHTSSN